MKRAAALAEFLWIVARIPFWILFSAVEWFVSRRARQAWHKTRSAAHNECDIKWIHGSTLPQGGTVWAWAYQRTKPYAEPDVHNGRLVPLSDYAARGDSIHAKLEGAP
jgi:hypothetical protein